MPSFELCTSFNCCKCIVFRIWILTHKTRTFSRLFHNHKIHLSALFGLFLQLQPVKFLPFHIPETWKRYPFRAEPSCMGQFREYPVPLGIATGTRSESGLLVLVPTDYWIKFYQICHRSSQNFDGLSSHSILHWTKTIGAVNCKIWLETRPKITSLCPLNQSVPYPQLCRKAWAVNGDKCIISSCGKKVQDRRRKNGVKR